VHIEFDGSPENITGTGQAVITLDAVDDASDTVAFVTPRLEMNWEINPFMVTNISWDAGSLIYALHGNTEEWAIDPGILANNDSGWLVMESGQGIGPSDWEGTLDIEIRDDFEVMQGQIILEKLPFDIIDAFTAIPDGFTPVDRVRLILTFNGPPGNPSSHGTVSNPVTREMFRF